MCDCFLNTSVKFISYLICFMLCVGENMDIHIEADKETEEVASLKNEEAHKKKAVKRDKGLKKMEHKRAGTSKGNL